jgi:hypothetical protein
VQGRLEGLNPVNCRSRVRLPDRHAAKLTFDDWF